MTSYTIEIDGRRFIGRSDERLLDAALRNGIDLPFDCRAGHCGTCCVRVVSGSLRGGHGAEPGIVHACQCRISSDAVVERPNACTVRSVTGVLQSLRSLSRSVVEVGIGIDGTLPNHAGQYAQVQFSGFPSRPYSITHPLLGNTRSDLICFHIRRMDNGRVTAALGNQIDVGHHVSLTGPYGSAHFRANSSGRLVLVATSTGFAPIWAIAVAALRENPARKIMIIAGGRTVDQLYMGSALVQLACFPNVHIVPVCSGRHDLPYPVMHGRPTAFMPQLLPTDTVYACGAPEMVAAIKAIAGRYGATCYADPFVSTTRHKGDQSVVTRALEWIAAPGNKRVPTRHAKPPSRRDHYQPPQLS